MPPLVFWRRGNIKQTNKKPAKGGKQRSTGARIFFGFLRFVAVCLCLGIMAASVGSVLLSLYVVKATANDSELLNLDELELAYTSKVFYREVNPVTGQENWPEYQTLESPTENRIWVDSDAISKNLMNAYVAIEDRDFWTHSGFNLKRTVFAVLNEVAYKVTGSYLRGGKQGASSINQQLIKNLTGEDEASGMEGYLRKLREIFRAMSLNSKYSKEMIMEAYLNTLDLTGSIGGVEMGANRYFNKHAGDEANIADGKQPLTYAQCASIASITKNPTEFSPITSPEKHLVRRNLVLKNMFDQGYIVDENGNPDQAAYEAALAEPLVLYETKTDENATKTSNNDWFVDALLDELTQDIFEANPWNEEDWTREKASNAVFTRGLRIYSTVVPHLQDKMEEVFMDPDRTTWPAYTIKDWVPKDAAEGTEPMDLSTQAAGVTINYKGELCAVVGGIGQKTEDRGLNRAIDSVRQVGSTMKGVAAYPLAMEYNYINFGMTLQDEPKEEIPDPSAPGGKREWPKNYSGTYTHGPVTIYNAVKQSLNTIAVWVGDLVGADEMYDFATETLGVTSLDPDGDRNLAPMVLGAMTNGMSPYQLAGCYMMYGSGGRYTNLHSYTTVEDFRGNVILEKDIYTVQAISEDTAYIMNRILWGVLHDAGGTARGLYPNLGGMGEGSTVGKTGTSNENLDVWFVGLTPYYCSSFWWGYDQDEDMMNTYNPSVTKHPSARAWMRIMQEDYEANPDQYPQLQWEMPENVEKRAYCTATGLAPNAGCPTATGYYKKDVPMEQCTGHA